MDTAPGFIALLISAVWRSILPETQSTNRNSSVSRMLKLAIVLVCFSLCGAGTFFVSTSRDEQSQQKTNVMPVKNRQLIQRTWIGV
jgi:flagellar basal body-associated protein FliL